MNDTLTSQPICLDYNDIFDVDNYIYFTQKMYTREALEKEIDFIFKRLSISTNDHILDLPCGYGKYTNIISEKGYNIVGVDVNLDFIRKAREDAKSKGINSTFLQQDMRKTDFANEFNLILTLDTSFGYFKHSENMQVLENVSKALVPGGFFYLDLMNPSLRNSLERGVNKCTAFDFDGNLLIDWRSYDSEQSQFISKRVYIKDGIRKDSCLKIRNYSFDEIKSMLSNVGLKVVEIFGGAKGRIYSDESYRLVIIAQKSK